MVELLSLTRSLSIFGLTFLMFVSVAAVAQPLGVDLSEYQEVRYVSDSNGADWDGRGTQSAPWKSLFFALSKITDAAESKRYAILMASGTYYGSGWDRTAFQMKPWVDVYGGFDPSDWSRDIAINKTILNGSNERRVLMAASHSSIDGFTITQGKVTRDVFPMFEVYGGGIWFLQVESSLLANCIIMDNTAVDGGGICCSASSPTLHNCVITGNLAFGAVGGGLDCRERSSPLLLNCIFTKNKGYIRGDSVYCDEDTSPKFVNCTLTQNSGSVSPSGIYIQGASPHLINSLLWNNGSKEIQWSGGNPVLRYCDVSQAWQGAGEHNISEDPRFIGEGNYHLQGSSPCIGKGIGPVLDSLVPAMDFDGQPRSGETSEIGAYQYLAPTPTPTYTPKNTDTPTLTPTIDINKGYPSDALESLLTISRWWLATPLDDRGMKLNVYYDEQIDERDLLLVLEANSGKQFHGSTLFALPRSGPAPLRVEFSLADPILETQVVSWAWDFQNDGNVDSTEPNPSFIYESSGSYSVSVSIQIATGLSLNYKEDNLVSVREPIETRIDNNVVVVENDPCLSYISKATDELNLEILCPPQDSISIGTIVIGTEEGGYARRVNSISQNGSLLHLQTEEIALTDIFDQADISGIVPITEDELRKAGFSIGLDGMASKEFNTSLVAGLTLTGEIAFDPSFVWDCKIKDWKLVYAKAGFAAQLDMSILAQVDVKAGLSGKKDDIKITAIPDIQKICWFQVGIVPVIIKANLSFWAGYDVNFNGSFSARAGYSISNRAEVAMEYKNGKFGPVGSLKITPQRIGPEITQLEANGKATIYIRPKIDILIYNLAGAGANAKGYLEGILTGDFLNTGCAKLEAFAGVNVGVQGTAKGGWLEKLGISYELQSEEISLVRTPLPSSPWTWCVNGNPSQAPPKPSFEASPNSGLAPLSVKFTDRSNPGDGVITQWNWTFGDNTSSSSQNPSHTYNKSGSYPVQLRVKGTSGSVDWAASKIITVNAPGTSPVLESFSLDGDESMTSDREVYLTTKVTGNPKEYQASEKASFSGASWKIFNDEQTFILSPEEGQKTVYFKARNQYGETRALSDSILYKKSPTSLQMVTLPPGSFLMGNTGTGRDSQYGYSDEYPRHTVNINYSFQMGKYEVTNAQYAEILNWAKGRGYLRNSSNQAYSGGDVYYNGQPLLVLGYDVSYIGGQFASLTRNNESMANHPVKVVTWYGSVAFCNWLSEKEGRSPAYNLSTWSLTNRQGGGYRLPSESEWEYACRGSSSNPYRYAPFSFGDDPNLDLNSCNFSSILNQYMVWCGNDDGWSETVGSKLPNDYGLYDMHGNVWEWCEDWWHTSYTGAPADGSAWSAQQSSYPYRVVRGGDWYGYAGGCRSAYRDGGDPDIRYYSLGFRLARTQ